MRWRGCYDDDAVSVTRCGAACYTYLRLLERLDPVLRVVELLVLLHQLELRVAPLRVQVLHLRGELLAAEFVELGP